MQINGKIFLFGDSVGKGVVFDEKRRRYCLARERCTTVLASEGLTIESEAYMGATIGEGYARFQDCAANPGDIAVIEYGGNDCDLDWDAVSAEPDAFHDGKTPLPVFRDTMRLFIRAARKRGLRPAVILPPPLEAERYYQWVCQGRDAERILQYLVDVHHIYRWHERYADVTRQTAWSEQCPLIDLRTPFLNAWDLPSLICRDGIHPNEEGQRLMARAVLSWLKKNHGESRNFFRTAASMVV